MAKEFIKVTINGENRSIIIPAANEGFYRSMKATIEKPTDEEIMAERPEVRMRNADTNKNKSIVDELNALRKENAYLKAENAAMKVKKASKNKSKTK